MAASFSFKKIDVSFRIAGANTLQGKEGNTVVAKGLRVQAVITKTGLSNGQGEIKIYGLPLDLMNRLSTYRLTRYSARGDEITVSAGDQNGVSLVFIGQIVQAYVDLNGQPDSCLVVSAVTGLMNNIVPVDPTSYSGSVDVANLLAKVAENGNGSGNRKLDFQNHGVTGAMISHPYYPGTVGQQIEAICHDANIDYFIDNDVLHIWPKGGSMNNAAILISAKTGMVGYPKIGTGESFLSFDTEFNPQLSPGTLVKVESIIEPASGFWGCVSITHTIESEQPGAPWFTHADCTLPEFSAAAGNALSGQVSNTNQAAPGNSANNRTNAETSNSGNTVVAPASNANSGDGVSPYLNQLNSANKTPVTQQRLDQLEVGVSTSLNKIPTATPEQNAAMKTLETAPAGSTEYNSALVTVQKYLNQK